MEQRSDRFHVQVSVGDHAVEMRATGEVDIATVGLLRAALWAAPARPLLRLDLSGVRLLSAAGVRALVAAHRRVRARGGELVLVDPAPMVARVLHVTGLDRVIPVRSGTAAAPPSRAPRVLAPLVPAPAGDDSSIVERVAAAALPGPRARRRGAPVIPSVGLVPQAPRPGASGVAPVGPVRPFAAALVPPSAASLVPSQAGSDLPAAPQPPAVAESTVTPPEPAVPGSLARALGSLVPVAAASSAPMLACV
ncbi:Anti-sigma-B factor antagonist [Micromonospora sp. MW-13]|nr:STAS domain-containing protein [Micromonospora sp. MW-13]RGC67548.1 Anti-sigma-B factor antagonist [Micromonospora sp. MW-13]